MYVCISIVQQRTASLLALCKLLFSNLFVFNNGKEVRSNDAALKFNRLAHKVVYTLVLHDLFSFR